MNNRVDFLISYIKIGLFCWDEIDNNELIFANLVLYRLDFEKIRMVETWAV